MDSLTHTVLGACLGEAIAGRQLGKKAMLFGALANNFPDIDVLASFFTSPAHNLLVHRGITHSLLCCTVLTFVFAWSLGCAVKAPEMTLRRWVMLIGSGLFLHIGMDALTSYGTGWFEPFSSYRVSFNTLFILDPFFMAPLLVCSIILLIKKRGSPSRFRTAQVGLVVACLYLLATVLIKIGVNQKVKNDLAKQSVPHTDYMTTPTPLNNLLWYIVARHTDTCRLSYYSVFDTPRPLRYQSVATNRKLLQGIMASPGVADLLQFSKGYYTVSRTDSSLLFSDLRFGQIGGWYDSSAAFVFNFDIMRYNNATHIQQGRFRSVGSKPLQKLVNRIAGE